MDSEKTVFKQEDSFFNRIVQVLIQNGFGVTDLKREMSSKELIDYLDGIIEHPTKLHYKLIELVWFRDFAWLNHIPDSLNTILRWTNSEQQELHHREYFERYIQFVGEDKIPDGEQIWVNSFRKKYSSLVNLCS